MNFATIAVGLAVAAVLVFATYCSVRSFRNGKCSGCKECGKCKRR
ncbi:MAG: FeoB-associated Cys-rich membrane protein [Candidatus Methanomethylophilaceae archaeon]|jgi:hypothetical protein|nr:FeoB-associated Cys-rich membrane protein [Candidatus Methanomethylophilaceae archaeon]NCA73790.1 FeoB-associated Cys-rich membrane protein [Gammaproteobacteria bacterium]MDD2936512.1 FeoB-associated Cys-rich membrane protein [Candidatus Methanomethylophilaceae archaeon]MDD3351821.1 FeoB-associated Cys-rich membrane protein [Candidatus Methanomethylophilaceae archaeon]MDD3987037.1 FeoB-associated Cys-rich membrane protein [Candidatus Methanomethylophilaceae archaeon]